MGHWVLYYMNSNGYSIWYAVRRKSVLFFSFDLVFDVFV